MAPPKSPWNKIVTNAPPAQNAFPSMGKTSAKVDKSASLASPVQASETYAKAQDDEIQVLQAIFMQDFEDIELKGAWSKTTDRAFRLRLKSFSDDETFAVLSVKFTATYPKTIPLLSLENATQLRQKTRQKIEKLIKSKPKELLGEVMIHDIATSIQDILEDEVTARENEEALPSLEEERAVQEAAANLLAKQQEQEMQKKKDEEKAEEDRVLRQMVDEEVRRKEMMKRRSRPAPVQTLSSSNGFHHNESGGISFDRMINVQDEGSSFIFSTVTALKRYAPKISITEVFTVDPVILQGGDFDSYLVLKRAQVNSSTSNEFRLKKAILKFEDELEDLKKLRQPNIISVLDFRIERPDLESVNGGTWEINILVEFASRGTLSEKLENDGALAVDKVRSWSIELLEALDFYHRNGVIHKRIHANNVLLCRPRSGGSYFVKLADAGYQESLHDLKDMCKAAVKYTSARSAFWIPPELSEHVPMSNPRTRKTDVWDLGIVFLQMIFGLDTPQNFSSPAALIDRIRLSEPLEEIIRKFFKTDPKKRPSAFDLIPCEFLRNNVPVHSRPASPIHSRLSPTSMGIHPDRRIRRESSTGLGGPFSRYANEWVESGRLGKGGYGEVVKARNKLDGRIYAIKKIKQNSASALTEVLSEVMLLSRLNHPYVVRYYTAWPEEEISSVSETEEDSSHTYTGEISSVSPKGVDSNLDFGHSTGGLDFISSSGFPKIEFEDDSDDEDAIVFESDGESTEDDNSGLLGGGPPLNLRRTTSSSRHARPIKITLYIQMEYCERHTLRDLIRKGLYDDPEESWRLFRQILEGLAHIHSHGIIHRDLKPDNIFIDLTNNPRIGDFGLATSGQYHRADKAAPATSFDGDMTRSIGTALYVAPELRSNVGGSYNDKVDMYSLGIIFFEMCHRLKTAMERDQVIRQLREKKHELPSDFQTPDKALQGSIIDSLISHRPSERPSSTELLRSGKVPLQIEDEAIKEALKALSDPNSPHYQKMMAAVFSQGPDNQVKDFAWDMRVGSSAHDLKASDVLLQSLIKERLSMIFRRHGAVEIQRQLLLPRSDYYSNNSVVKLLDATGTLVQLPYDLTLPYARSIGRGVPTLEKTFTVGTVYRDNYTGGAPRSNGEADFDIVSYDTLDLALKEAEVIKVMDEVVDEFPSLSSAQMCFHLNHSDLLDFIMAFCRINMPQRPAVKEVLSKLNIQHFTWQKIRNELHSASIGVSQTSINDLSQFDWRDTPEKAFTKIRNIFEGTEYLDKTHAIFAHLSTVVGYMKRLNIHRKVYISPLSSFNQKFYAGGILFQCLYDTKRREVLAAGGRYDRLIEEYRPKGQGHLTGCHGVGMNLGWDRLVSSMARYHKNVAKSAFLKKSAEEDHSGMWAPRRCDILVASFDSTVLRSTGVKMVADLWSHDLSAELAIDARSPEELLAHYRDDKHSWIIIIKHDGPTSGKPDLKVKSIVKKEDTDIRSTDLLSYLRAELRDRDHREGSTDRQRPSLARTGREPSGSSSSSKANVDVLISAHRSKKSNKWGIIEAAQTRSRELLNSFGSAPIAAIEAKEEVMDLIRETRLSDPDGWRRAIQSLPIAERKYLQELLDLLHKYAEQWRNEVGSSKSVEGGKAFIYNFRTGGCLLYDLGA